MYVLTAVHETPHSDDAATPDHDACKKHSAFHAFPLPEMMPSTYVSGFRIRSKNRIEAIPSSRCPKGALRHNSTAPRRIPPKIFPGVKRAKPQRERKTNPHTALSRLPLKVFGVWPFGPSTVLKESPASTDSQGKE